MVNQDDKAGEFLWEIHCDLLLYSANRIPEITESVESIDRAMQWGFQLGTGPVSALGCNWSQGICEAYDIRRTRGPGFR